MPNYDGIYELRIFYTTTPPDMPTLEHRHTIDVALNDDYEPGEPFTGIETNQPNSAGDPLSAVTTDYVTLIKAMFSAETDFSRAELWKIPEGTFAGIFIASYTLGQIGTSVEDAVPAHQTTLTFRSLLGGVGRAQFMEATNANNSRETGAYTYAPNAAVSNYIISSECPFVARDNSRMFSPIADNEGQNEKLWRKRYRAT